MMSRLSMYVLFYNVQVCMYLEVADSRNQTSLKSILTDFNQSVKYKIILEYISQALK